MFGVVYQVAILRYHRYDAVDRMDGVNTPAGGYHFSAVIPSAIIFVVLAIIAFAVGGDEQGFWLVLPFGWLMISSIYYFVMTYRNFAGSVTPFRHVGRASFVAWAIFYLLSFVGVMFSMFSTTGNPLWDAFITLWSWIGLAFGVIIAFIRNARSQDLETQELEAFYREK